MRKQLFIEKIMPVKLLNQQVYYEHGGNPFKGLHRWYSRKPLSFSRASVLASLLPADISMEEFLYIMGIYSQEEIEFWEKSTKTEEEKDKLRNIKEIRLYKQPPTQKQIERLKHHCQTTWGKETPSILDAFAGGGSIPFEGVRYGLNVFASDLNPVAVITMKAAMEYPLKFGKDLQQDIDKWVNYVAKEAEIRLAEFFPSTMEVPLTKGDLGGSHSAIASSPSSNTTKANLGDSNQGSMIPPSPPSKGGSNIETVQNYLWAHTVTCPHCHSTIPLSPNWWIDRSPSAIKNHRLCAVKPIPNLLEKRVDFELIKGRKGKGNTILINNEEFDPNDYNTIGRGVGKCCNCGQIIEDDYIKQQAQNEGLGHQLYAVAFKQRKGSLEFRLPNQIDLEGVKKAEKYLQDNWFEFETKNLIAHEATPTNPQYSMIRNYGVNEWHKLFNPRQLLTLVTYVEIINEAKGKIQAEYEPEKAEAIITYLALVFDRCFDMNCRLSGVKEVMTHIGRASATHALNLMWNYPEVNGAGYLYKWCASTVTDDFTKLCEYFNNQKKLNNQTKTEEINLFNYEQNPVEQASSLLDLLNNNETYLNNDETYLNNNETYLNNNENYRQDACATQINREINIININLESADSLYHIPDKSLEAIITDPPYYGTIPYADISDFFYVWNKRILGDIFPDIFYQELTDKDREAVANPSRFRNMGESADVLARRDYEAKMAMAWNEAYRVLRDDGVLTVQFNHKESGAWDVLAKALIDAGFEITASWAVSTENPQNLHQAKKNSVSSTVILVCRKRVALTPNPSPRGRGQLKSGLEAISTPSPLGEGGRGGEGMPSPLGEGGRGGEGMPSPLGEGGRRGEGMPSPLGEGGRRGEGIFTGAWWDDLRPEVANQVEARASYFEDNDITGIDLYLSAFGVALNVFSKSYPILDNTGNEVRPEVAFAEARKAIAGYRFRKLLQTDTVGFDALTQWYLLAWDAFTAREFPFDEARQLALAIGGFNVNDLAREYKLIDSASGTCKLLTPQQRLKKRAFTVNPQEFKMDYLIDGLHALIAVYEEEGNLEAVRQFMKKTGLNENDLLTKAIEIAFKVIPDSMKEKQTLINLWLGIDEIKAKVQYFQLSIDN